MSRPANHSLFPNDAKVQDALLLLLFKHGGETYALWANETYHPLADFFNLSDYARSVTRDAYLRDGRNEPYWHTWVQFSRDRLVAHRNLHPVHSLRRGLWRLTDQGKRRAAKIAVRTPPQPFGAYTPSNPVSPIWLKSPAEMLDELGF